MFDDMIYSSWDERSRRGLSALTSFALQGLEPYASWRKLADDALIKPFTNPKAIHVVVAGGKVQTMWIVTDFGIRRGVLIDDWA